MSGRAREAARAVVGIRPGGAAVERTRAFLREGVIELPAVRARVPYDGARTWTSTDDRAVLRRLHGLLFIGDWAASVASLDPRERGVLRERAERVLRCWLEHYGRRTDASPAMAFHDETTAQRLMMLHAAEDHGVVAPDPGEWTAWRTATAELLARDDFYAGCNNHGMFQDQALLVHAAYARLGDVRARAWAELAAGRLAAYARASFGPDGVHREHAPSYHLMVARQLGLTAALVAALGIEASADVDAVIRRAERFATHLVTPAGRYPLLSDTTRQDLASEQNFTTFPSPQFRYAATAGLQGVAPDERVAVFAASGYGVFRSSWGPGPAAFAVLSSAYNGSYHKHADELSLELEVGGVPVLAEAGPNGYNYDDPLTKYAYSSFAHNGIVVDGVSLPRHDGFLDRTWLDDSGSDDAVLDVTGCTTRYDGVRLTRRLRAEGGTPDSTVLVVDDAMRSDEERQYRTLWHFGPDIVPLLRGDYVELFHHGSKIAELALDQRVPARRRLVRGVPAPAPQGWYFPRMGEARPAWVLESDVIGTDVDVRTTVRTGGFVLRDRAVRPVGGDWAVSETHVPLRYCLDLPENGRPTRLVVVFSSLHAAGDFTSNYRETLAGSTAARLYVLDDFGDQGCYYYAHGRDTDIYRSVQALVRGTAERLGLPPASVLTAGSSKGGTAALVHGLALGARHIVVGAPQVRVGTFLAAAHPDVLRYLSGGVALDDRAWADGIVARHLRDGTEASTAHVLVGTGDHHYRGHVLPLAALAGYAAPRVEVYPLDGTPHDEIGAPYRVFLRAFLGWWAEDEGTPRLLTFDAPSRRLRLTLAAVDGPVALRLYRGREVVDRVGYAARTGHVWTLRGRDTGRYRVRVFRRGAGAEPAVATTNAVVVPRAGGAGEGEA